MVKFKNKNIVPAAGFILALLLISSFSPAIRNPILDMISPPLNLLSLLKREVNGLIFFHRNFIQNEKLRIENDSLRQKLNAAGEIYQQNSRLKELLRLKQESSRKVIAAEVIGRSADNWSSAIIINKGRYSGIRPGMAAVSYLGLAGRVVETSGSTSKILLINDPNLAVSSLVKRSRQEGLISGTLGNYLIMKYLPRDSDIQVSDTIITSGLTKIYPKGLIIGEVVGIGDQFSGLSRYALIKPAVDFSSIEEVLIIIQ